MKTFIFCALLYFISLDITAQSIENGEVLFNTNCKACHTVGDGKRVGPDLANVTDRRDKEWVFKFIKNSSELIQSGDEEAVAIFEENNKLPMPPHPFSDEQLEDLVAYMDSYEAPVVAEVTEKAPANIEENVSFDMPVWFKIMAGSFVIAALGLIIFIGFLIKMLKSV